jgi:hypothetical protein
MNPKIASEKKDVSLSGENETDGNLKAPSLAGFGGESVGLFKHWAAVFIFTLEAHRGLVVTHIQLSKQMKADLPTAAHA